MAGEHLRAVLGAERVRLVGQDDQRRPARLQVGQVDVRVAAGVVGVDVVQAEPGGQVAGERARSHHHPGIAPDRDGGADPRTGDGLGPDLLGAGEPGGFGPAQREAEHPAQRRHRLVQVPDHRYPHRDPGRAQALHVDPAVLLLVGQHQVGLERPDRGQVGILGAADPGHVQVSGMGAPGGRADQRPGAGHRHRLGQGRHQRDHPPGGAGQRDVVAEIVLRRGEILSCDVTAVRHVTLELRAVSRTRRSEPDGQGLERVEQQPGVPLDRAAEVEAQVVEPGQ